MRLLLRTLTTICFITCLTLCSFAQDKVPHNISLRVGAGNSISMKHFSQEETSLNIPNSSFINIGLSTNLIQRSNRSLFLGIEMQALNYYPTLSEKTDLSFASLLIGKTRKFDLAQGLYLKYTGGLSLGTLVGVTSSISGYDTYSGGPFKNLNFGLFNNLQVLFGGEKAKNKNFDYGLGFDFAINDLPIYNNKIYPSYLKHNGFIQYGIGLVINYNLRKRVSMP
jgi:hypothetical protein